MYDLGFFTAVFYLVMPILALFVSIFGIWLLVQIITLYKARNEPRNQNPNAAMAQFLEGAKKQYTSGEITREELEAIKQAVV